MWIKFRDQLPILLVTVIIVTAAGFGAGWWLQNRTISNLTAKQDAALTEMREKYAAELRATNDESARRIDALSNVLREAIQKRAADSFMTDEEFAKENAVRINRLADAIAVRIQPFNPTPHTPEEAERTQNEQIDRVSARMADKINPILAEMARDQNLTRQSLATYSQRISDQVGTVLNGEIVRNQQLNANLITTNAIARDSLRLSQEVTALYLTTFKDQGLVTRILSLPANVVKDVATLSIVSGSDKKKTQQRLFNELADLDRRLNEAQAEMPKQ